jgi:ribosomal protein S18 acetylase RimI-like enzyme
MNSTWRPAKPTDDTAIIALALALYREDPSSEEVPAEANTRRTLAELRATPTRGRAVVLEHEGRVRGYALLIAYWSNELGGEMAHIDEVYVAPELRSQGHASALVAALPQLWPGALTWVQLEVSPANVRARALYERLGFTPMRNTNLRRRIS